MTAPTPTTAPLTFQCQNCIYFGHTLNVCRRNSPTAFENTTGRSAPTQWPIVDPVNDWCAEGYSNTQGWYDLSPTPPPSAVRTAAKR